MNMNLVERAIINSKSLACTAWIHPTGGGEYEEVTADIVPRAKTITPLDDDSIQYDGDGWTVRVEIPPCEDEDT
jgi:hypothetical protein